MTKLVNTLYPSEALSGIGEYKIPDCLDKESFDYFIINANLQDLVERHREVDYVTQHEVSMLQYLIEHLSMLNLSSDLLVDILEKVLEVEENHTVEISNVMNPYHDQIVYGLEKYYRIIFSKMMATGYHKSWEPMISITCEDNEIKEIVLASYQMDDEKVFSGKNEASILVSLFNYISDIEKSIYQDFSSKEKYIFECEFNSMEKDEPNIIWNALCHENIFYPILINGTVTISGEPEAFTSYNGSYVPVSEYIHLLMDRDAK